MRVEYAIEGVGTFKHWSDAYGRLGGARRAAKDLVRVANRTVHILQRLPLPAGYEIGARWRIVAIVTHADPKSVYKAFAKQA